MGILPATPPRGANPLSATPLDRASERRTDAAWVATAFADPHTQVVPVSEGRVLVADAPAATGEHAAPRARTISRAEFGPLPAAAILLGLGASNAPPNAAPNETSAPDHPPTVYVAAAVPAADAPRVLGLAGPGAWWSELRPAALALPSADAALVAYARAMVWWHSRHGFCGVCGAATAVEEAGHVRACPNCHARHFPRTDPAVIVLVTHRAPGAPDADEACLLANQPSWPATMHSTLAGFVEPGESLEDTVRRELYEEVGVRVDDPRYDSSQPWPFPQSLMLGFRARAHDRAVRVDGVEIRAARWFTRTELTAALADGSVTLPVPLSISRRLIEGWRNQPAG